MELIFLHGGAASGKLTTARALASRLGYPVFHNHLVVDLLTTVFPFGSESFVRLREEMWLSVFRDAARASTSLIFTFAPENTVQRGFPARVAAAVEEAGGRVRFVRLLVSEAEQERRVVEASRREFHKLSSLETLLSLREKRGEVEQPPAELEIDTDDSDPARSAEAIIARFGLSVQAPVERYGSP
jgi:hypothetical protein